MPERETCETHEGNALIATCAACGKGICRECRDEFGYFCSQECLVKTKGSVDPAKKKEAVKRIESTRNVERTVKAVFKLILLGIILGIGYMVWSMFFSPYGKVAWKISRDISPEGFIKVAASDGSLVFISDGAATDINTKDGKLKSQEKESAYRRVSLTLFNTSSGLLLRGEDTLACVSKGGKLKWDKQFDNSRILSAGASDSGALALVSDYSAADEDEDMEALAADLKKGKTKRFKRFHCLSVADGSELWGKPAPEGEYPTNITVGNGHFAYVTHKYTKTDVSYLLKVCDFKAGSELWQIKVNSLGSWGPLILGDKVLFSSGGSLNAVSIDGKSKLWSVKFDGDMVSEDDFKISRDMLFVNGYERSFCIDLKEGRLLWQKTPEVYARSFVFENGRIFISGTESGAADAGPADTDKMPKTLDELKDEDMNSGAIAKIAGKGMKRGKPCLHCIDASTGETIWRRENIQGVPVYGDGRLVMVYDTADSMLNMIGGTRKGDTCVFQINPENGKDIVSGSDPIGMAPPYSICGNRLVGLVYDRQSGSSYGMGKASSEKYLGLAAIALK